jgi:hypothetical protein
MNEVGFQWVINAGFSLIATIFGWLARQLWDAVGVLKKDLSVLREEIANDRVHKSDFRDLSDAIFRKLDRIEDKLDDKADKSIR